MQSMEGKFSAVVEDIAERHKKGQPVLVGTVAIETSEIISKYLSKKGIHHNVLNAKNHEREAEIIANAGHKGAVTIATNMAGRGTDIKLGEGVIEVGGLAVIGTERHEAVVLITSFVDVLDVKEIQVLLSSIFLWKMN